MESKRQQKVGKLIQKDISEIFQKEEKHLVDGEFVTVTNVRMSPDLSLARVYLSFLKDNNREVVVEKINENVKSIRHFLGVRIRHQLRIVPHLNFYIDDTADYVEKIDKLFADLVIPPETPES